MIYSLNILTERVIRDLSGGDVPDDSPYDFDFVQAHLVDAMREDLKMEMQPRRGTKMKTEKDFPMYIATYDNVTVSFDKATSRAYIDLPSAYNRIHAISPMKKPLLRMIPVSNPGVFAQLPDADFEQQNFGYYPEGLKAFFMRDILKDEFTKVLLKLFVAAPDTLSADASLPLYPENVGRIIDIAKNRVLNRLPQDRLGDGNPNLRPANV